MVNQMQLNEEEIFRRVANQELDIDEALAILERLNREVGASPASAAIAAGSSPGAPRSAPAQGSGGATSGGADPGRATPGRATPGGTPPVIEDSEFRYELSENQKALWFIQRLAPENYAYNSPAAFRLNRDLDIAALRRCFQTIVDRHPCLRTVFLDGPERAVQLVQPKAEVDFRERDVAGLSAAAVQALMEEEVRLPFDLEKGPLMRVVLYTAAGELPILLMTFHHIIFDGTSFGSLVNELCRIYPAMRDGGEISLDPLAGSYREYVNWQREMLAGEEGESHWAYWQDRLGGELPIVSLPGDYPRPPVQTFTGDVYAFELRPDLMRAMTELARSEGCTLFAAMFAAFKILLYHYTRQKDLIVGTPIAGRPRSVFEETIGYFVNMVAVRDRLPRAGFREFLKQMQRSVMEAIDHGDFPLPLLVERLRVEPDRSRTPIFQVCFIFQNWVQDLGSNIVDLGVEASQSSSELRLASVDSIHETGGFDLTLDIFDVQGKTKAFFKYNPDLYSRPRIARMAEHYRTLLDNLVAEPERLIFDLQILSEAERHKILFQFNDTDKPYPRGLTVHRLIEAEVARNPGAIAVAYEGAHLSYGELNARANRLARKLCDLGVGTETLVGLFVERSLETIIGVLGILKAGGTYVPLDPTNPKQRLTYMLEDANPPVILTRATLRDEVPPHKARVLCFEELEGDLEDADGIDLELRSTAEHLAYVTFTSGSTGRPKGVMISHDALVNAYQGWEEAYHLRESATAHLQMANFTFDVFSGDFVRALCSGAKLVICPKDKLLEPQELYKVMVDEDVDAAEFVPAVLRALIGYLGETGQDLSFMNLLVAGSDSWSVKEYDDFRRFCGPQTRLINSYGVTEATIDCSFFESNDRDLAPSLMEQVGIS